MKPFTPTDNGIKDTYVDPTPIVEEIQLSDAYYEDYSDEYYERMYPSELDNEDLSDKLTRDALNGFNVGPVVVSPSHFIAGALLGRFLWYAIPILYLVWGVISVYFMPWLYEPGVVTNTEIGIVLWILFAFMYFDILISIFGKFWGIILAISGIVLIIHGF